MFAGFVYSITSTQDFESSENDEKIDELKAFSTNLSMLSKNFKHVSDVCFFCGCSHISLTFHCLQSYNSSSSESDGIASPLPVPNRAGRKRRRSARISNAKKSDPEERAAERSDSSEPDSPPKKKRKQAAPKGRKEVCLVLVI